MDTKLKFASLLVVVGICLGVALASAESAWTLAPWHGSQSDMALLSDSLGEESRAAEGRGEALASSFEVATHQSLIQRFESANKVTPARWVILLLGLAAALFLGLGAQIRLILKGKLYDARAAHSLQSLAWIFLPNAIIVSTIGACIGGGLALWSPHSIVASNAHFALDPSGLGLEIGHWVSMTLGATLFLLPFPQFLRGAAEKLRWMEGDTAYRALSVTAGLCAIAIGATLRSEAIAGLILPLLALTMLLLIARKNGFQAIAPGFLGAISPYFGRSSFADRESAFWLARSFRFFCALALSYLVISGVESQGGEASLRVFFVVVIASSLLSAFGAALLCSGGLVWWFFAEGAGLDVRMGASLSAYGSGFIICAAFADSLLSAAWLARRQPKENIVA